MGLKTRRRGWRRPAGSTVLTVSLAVLIAGPLIGLPISFIVAPGHFGKFSNFLPEAFAATGILLVGVGTGTLVLGTSLAALVSFCDFPGRSWIEWVLVLPLAMPGYVFTLFALGLDVPNIRSAGGAVVIFTLVLYPYVYLLARSAFLSQSRTLMEAARGLGLSRGAAIVRVGLPLARPAILGGRGAGADGDAGRLRHREPAGCAHVHRRHLSRLVQRLRPRGGNAVRHDPDVDNPAASPRGAAREGPCPLPLRRLPRRRDPADSPARPGSRGRRGAPAAARRGRAGRAGRAALGVGRAVGPEPPAGARVRHRGAQQPAPVSDERGAGAVGGAGTGLRRALEPLPNGGRGGPPGYDRVRPAGVGGGGGGDRAARMARPPPRGCRRDALRSGPGTDLHRNRDRIVLRLPRPLPRARVGCGGVQPGAHPARSWTTRRGAWARIAST